jgi:ABC-2 type transport system permease protein
MLGDGSIDAIVTIPKGFIASVMQSMQGGSESALINVEGSGTRTLQGQIAASIVRSYANTMSSISADFGVLLNTVLKSGDMAAFNSIDIEGYMQKAVSASAAQAAEISQKGIAARKPLTSFMYYSIAITCMFVLYSAGQGSSFLYTEWEEKTLHRLSAAGVSKRKLLLGKSAAVFLLCVLQLIVLFAFSTLAFKIDWGNAVSFILISVCVAISVTGLGVLLMVLVYRAGNPRLGSVFQSIIVQVLALFGGSYMPLSVLPKFFSTISLITPNGLAIQAFTGSVTGAPLAEVLPYMGGSVALGAALYFLGVALFPRERRA